MLGILQEYINSTIAENLNKNKSSGKGNDEKSKGKSSGKSGKESGRDSGKSGSSGKESSKGNDESKDDEIDKNTQDMEKIFTDDDEYIPTTIEEDNIDTTTEEIIDEILDTLIGGSINELTIDGSKRTVIVVPGFMSQEIFSKMKSLENVRYVDASKEEQKAYSNVMDYASNDYMGKDEKEKKIAKALHDILIGQDAQIVFVKLYNQQYNVVELLNLFSKDKDTDVFLITYSFDYWFDEALAREKRGIHSKPTTWFFNVLNMFYVRSTDAKKKTEYAVSVNKKDLKERLNGWKKYYESEKALNDDIKELMGNNNECQFIPNFKYTKNITV